MKIIVIGSPGSGKSTLARRINSYLKLPILHLDRIYHTGKGKEHISRDELIKEVDRFASLNNSWIIDGNYSATIEQRIKLADTIVLLDLSTEICLRNVYIRADERINKGIEFDDMAEGFDFSITQDFIEYVQSFRGDVLPDMLDILRKYKNRKYITLKSQEEIDRFIDNLETQF